MRSPNKKPEANRRQSKSHRSSGSVGTENDADSAQLKKIGKVMGNQHVRDALHGSSAQRDALLKHITDRLHVLRGAQLIKQAAAAEEAAFSSVPKFVQTSLETHQQAEAAPESTHMVNDEGSCTGCGKPADLKVADQILNLSDKMEPTPPLKAKKRRWWDEEKEEEEEQEDNE